MPLPQKTILMALILGANAVAAPRWEHQFQQPPRQCWPWVYWFFMDGHRTREGLTADLEAMRQAGIGGAILLEVDLGLPRGPVPLLSEEWRRLLVHTVGEARRLGIELALGAGPGWCGTGGPWVAPEQAMQHLVAAETNLAGPGHFDALLPQPQPRQPFFGVGTLTPELARQWRTCYLDVAVLAFPRPAQDKRLVDLDEKALFVRAPYSSSPGVKSALPPPADQPDWPAAACIPRQSVIDLTPRLAADGRLQWDVPPGEWTILRFGRTLTGQTTRPAPQPGLGFETDKFDPAALDAHLERYVGALWRDLGGRGRGSGGLTMLHFDSWEMSAQNWSARFRDEFRRRRGYDPLPWLPAFTGRVVEKPALTERFLWDVRQTAQELVITNHLGRLRDYAHRRGLQLSVEPYDMNPCADLSLGAVADVPMAEFWWRGFDTTYSVIEAVSLAHTGGRPLVAAEAFTSEPGEDWQAHPANLKALGDWAFAAGINRLAFHRYQHQPWLDRRPGMRMGAYGVHWERTQTWWPLVRAYHEYLARCQLLLRQGEAVVDILFLTPEGAPHVFRPPPDATVGSPPDRRGYSFDGCAPDTLRARARVEQGQIVFPGGSRYRLLVLPLDRTMTPELLGNVRELVLAGATIVGPPPTHSPSLSNYPHCDEEVRSLAGQLWGASRAAGGGRVVWEAAFEQGVSADALATNRPIISTAYPPYAVLARLLSAMGVPPDFEADGPIRHAHRRDGDAHLYFVSSRADRPVDARCVFRVTGLQPELWHPVTGERRALPHFETRDGRTTIPLRFEPLESYFIVFRRPVARRTTTATANFNPLTLVTELSGPWEVSFDPRWGGPEHVTFPELVDWSRHSASGIRHYSGLASYRKSFVAPGWPSERQDGPRLFLDLGTVKNLARVRLNGQDCGVAWCAPWRVEVTGALRAGTNELEVTVANLWINRLIGDAALPPEQRLTWTTANPYKPDSPLSPSGLLGPVRLLREQLLPAADRATNRGPLRTPRRAAPRRSTDAPGRRGRRGARPSGGRLGG